MLQTVVLAGGLGTRVRPAYDNLPKSLIPIFGRPFLAWQLELLQKNGVTEVILCVSHKSDLIEKYISEEKSFGMQILFSYDGIEQIGTGGAVINALPLLDEHFMVIYGDSYLPVNFKRISDLFINQDKPALMTVLKNDLEAEPSNVFYSEGNIIKYSKFEHEANMEHIDFGLNFFTQKAFIEYSPGLRIDLSDIQKNLSMQHNLAGYEVLQRYYEVGSIQGIADFEKYLGGFCE